MIVHDHVREGVDFAEFFESMREAAGGFAYVLTYSPSACARRRGSPAREPVLRLVDGRAGPRVTADLCVGGGR